MLLITHRTYVPHTSLGLMFDDKKVCDRVRVGTFRVVLPPPLRPLHWRFHQASEHNDPRELVVEPAGR